MSDNKLIPPPHIVLAHWSEWIKGSGVSAKITSLNVKSLSLPEEIDELLNRNTKSRWKHWQHGAGWAVMGVDPNDKTAEPIYNGAQFKPDTPVHRHEDGVPKFKRDGSPDLQKYFSASGVESEPLFLQMDDREYWLKVKADTTHRIILTEGAKKAGAALTAGEACISIPGVSNGQRKGRLKKQIEQFCTSGRNFILGFDSDMFHNPNVCKALDKLGCLLKSKGAIVHVLMLPQETKGIDDFIVAHGHEAFRQLVDNAMTFEEWREQDFKRALQQVRSPMDFIPDVEENIELKAQTALFSDRPWVSIDKQMYCWTGTHYQLQSEAAIERMISDWCAKTPVYVQGEWKFAYAKSQIVNNILAWVLKAFSVDPATVNPPGLNCLSGVIKVSWQDKQPSYELVKHDPSIVYTYVGEFECNRAANPAMCDKLLLCLDPPQRDVFIRTLAASLDLPTIRTWMSRVKALLCNGLGNNGKDTLREVTELLYGGNGVVSCTFKDFGIYDEGKKFPLAKLAQARVSWSSENSDLSSLDNLQSLKAAISGDTLDCEFKNQNDRPMKPNCVFFFNINNVPNLQASMEAIQSRWAVLDFNKTFKVNADPTKGELEADPRFRYDPDFLKREVVPSLLNKMLAALSEVAMNGIDYSCTEEKLEEIQQETNHLRRFAKEVGLAEIPGGRVYINDLWEKLREWYIANGTLVITTDGKGKEKQEWHDQPRRGDKNVKAPNQIYQRFHEIFPKVRRERDNSNLERKGQFYLAGLGFGNPGEIPQQFYEEASVADRILELFQKLSPKDQSHIVKLLLLDSPLEESSVNGSPFASPSASPKPLDASPNVSASDSPVTLGDSSQAVISPGMTGDNLNNSTKNFPDSTDVSDLKVGDKCRAKKPHSFYLPDDKELTILNIEGKKASVTFPGCRSMSGVDAYLWELSKINGQD